MQQIKNATNKNNPTADLHNYYIIIVTALNMLISLTKRNACQSCYTELSTLLRCKTLHAFPIPNFN